MVKKVIPILLLLMLLLTSCTGNSFFTGLGTPIPLSVLLTGKGGKFTPTPTPFQPTDLDGDPEDATPTPTVIAATPTPSGIISLGLERPKGQINVLLLGSDWRPGQGFRTDVIMLLSLMPEQGIATLMSFPRDLYVEIPGVGYERINASQEYGGIDLTRETFEYNFDIPIDYYMITNFAGFVSIINTLGGINVNASNELYDSCDLPQAVEKMCYVPAGRTSMDGQTALWYVRSRYSTDDFDRTRRAQEVIIAILQKLMSLDAVNRAGELFELFQNSVETDIPLTEIVRLMPMATKIIQEPATLQRFAITEEDITHYIVPGSGAMVLIPNNDAIAEIIKKAIYLQ